MKFRKTLASVCAAAVAVSSLAVSAFAAWKGADKDGNVDFDVSSFLPKGVELSEVYGVKVTVTDASADAIAKGAGGGIVYNTSRGWNQKSWCNGCDKEEHDIQFDAATKSITRLDDTPAFQADDEWMSLTLSEWWGDDEIEVAKIEVLNKDGVVLPIAEEPTPVEPADPVDPADPADPVAPGTSEDVEETVDIAIKNAGKTVIDSGLVRTNIVNEWAGDDACVIANKDDFKNAVKIKVKFTVSDFTTPFKAWIAFMGEGAQYWGEGNTANANAEGKVVNVTGNGEYDVELTFANKVAATQFIAVCTDLKAAEGDAIPTIAIDSVKAVVDNTPADPSDPSDPTTPDEPAKPGDKTDPVKPGDSTDPVKPDDKTDPVKPGDSTDPVKPGDSTDPVKPGDSTKPGDDNKKPSDDNKKPTNPNAGVAVAVVPAAVAAAAVAAAGIVLKKRK